jgi:hypothetical protein
MGKGSKNVRYSSNTEALLPSLKRLVIEVVQLLPNYKV